MSYFIVNFQCQAIVLQFNRKRFLTLWSTWPGQLQTAEQIATERGRPLKFFAHGATYQTEKCV